MSSEQGVVHADSIATSFSGLAFWPCRFDCPDFQSLVVVVGQEDRRTVFLSLAPTDAPEGLG